MTGVGGVISCPLCAFPGKVLYISRHGCLIIPPSRPMQILVQRAWTSKVQTRLACTTRFDYDADGILSAVPRQTETNYHLLRRNMAVCDGLARHQSSAVEYRKALSSAGVGRDSGRGG